MWTIGEKIHMRDRLVKIVLVLLLVAVLGYVSWLTLRRRMLSSFEFLERGMSLEEIIDRVGEPDRRLGSGILTAEYDLIDGRTVRLLILRQDEISAADVCDRDGTCTELLED
jgi:hypothetical protein